MEVKKTNIDGVLIIEPRLFKDSRGCFFESFSQREFDEKVAPILDHKINFCQDNESMGSAITYITQRQMAAFLS